MPPDVTIGSFRFSIGLKRVTFFGDMLFTNSNAFYIINPEQPPKETGILNPATNLPYRTTAFSCTFASKTLNNVGIY